MLNTITYNLGKFCADILKPAVQKIKNRIAKSVDFLQKLKNVTLVDKTVMCSLDVVGLFPNTDTNCVLNLLPNILKNTEDKWRKTCKWAAFLPIDMIIKIIQLVIKYTHLKFLNVIYEQIFGTLYGVANFSRYC